MNDILIRALRKQPTERTPIWIMRQAGRYLPEYQAVRKKYSFMEMVSTPELAAEVTLQPIDILGVDAAIIFSDILVIPDAMGLELELIEKRGPVFHNPLRDPKTIEQLHVPDEAPQLQSTIEAVRVVADALRDRVPVIGFAGAPWTLAAYMIEGSGSKTFQLAKSFLYNEPKALHQLLKKLSNAVVTFLQQQIAAGAKAVQVFDSWAGQLTPDQFAEFSLPYLQQIVAALKPTEVPVIVFARNADHSLEKLAATGAHALGIDWQTDLARAKARVGDRVALQGNLDPMALYAKPEVLRNEIDTVLEKYGAGNGHVFNLGHGITPQTPVANVKLLVNYLREKSAPFHT